MREIGDIPSQKPVSWYHKILHLLRISCSSINKCLIVDNYQKENSQGKKVSCACLTTTMQDSLILRTY